MPTYNEAQNIDKVLERVANLVIPGSIGTLYALVVDSNSPDQTADIAKEYISKHNLGDRFFVVTEARRGIGQAYDTGFAEAIARDADVVIQMDSDLSHNPAVIPELIDAVFQGADMAIGSRYVDGGFIPGEWPVLRVINSRVARAVARKIGGLSTEINDPTAGFKAIRTSALQDLEFKASDATGYVVQVKMVHQFSKAGYSIVEIPISFSDRQYGESKIRKKDILQFIWFCTKLRFDRKQRKVNSGARFQTDSDT